ncbi:MAG: putative lipoprotein [Frankiales bacterium]|nr:putative lipoprotein [Frankiales bacterium]
MGSRAARVLTRRRVLLLTLLVLVVGASGVAAPLAGALPEAADSRVVLPDGRAYVLHVPPGLREDPSQVRGRPVMVVLHGLDTGPADAASSTGFNDLADRDRALVAYPEGVRDSFNAGLCCGAAARLGVDDVGFLTRVVEDLRRRGAGRISVVGFSNGGMMAYRFACERPGLVDTVGVLSGTLEIPRCDGRITVLHLHGDRDTAVPLEGAVHSTRLDAFLRRVSTIQPASPGSTITFRLLSPFPHRWTQPGDPVDASEEFWAFAGMTRRE